MKKLICSVLALLMAISPLSVFALTDAPVVPPGNTPVTLTATPLTFNATVPTGLPLDLAADGVVTPATEASIINGSIGPIKVVSITTEAVDGWKLTNYTDDFSTKKVNSKDIALQFNKDNVQSSGGITLTPQNWPTIEGNGSLRLDYQGKLASQSTDFVGATAAHVSFVLDWDNSINNPNDFLNLETSKDTLDIDETATLSVTQKEQSPITWSNSNPSVVELTETQGRSGITTKNIKAIGLGRSTISVQDELGNSASQDIIVIENELMGIKIVQQPAKTEYNENEIFNPEGMELKTYYKLGNEHDLLYYTYDNTPIKLDQASVTISYTEKDKTVTVECPITVASRDSKYVLATDADFSGTKNGKFQYIGTDKYVEVPHIIKGIPVTSYYRMFYNTSVEGVKSSNTNVTTMNSMFEYSKATTLDISNLDTSNVTNMWSMFAYSKATTLDVSNLDTTNVTIMNSMFANSQSTTLDISNFDTTNVTTMNSMFWGSQATTLDVSNFDTSKVTDMGNMFTASKVTTLDVSNFNTSNVTSMSGMFSGIETITTLDIRNFNTSNVTDMSTMFAGSQATILDLSNFDTSKVTNMRSMFHGNKLTTLDLSNFNTSNVTDMSQMFRNSQATTLDLSNFDTSKVTNMNGMFEGSKATTLDLSSFDTSNVTLMNGMFSSSLATTLDLSNFNTSNVTLMNGMFSSSLSTTLDLSSFDTSKVTNMSGMFRNSQATILDLSSFNTSNVDDMNSMFAGSLATTINVSNFNTASVTNMTEMFEDSQATILDLSSFNTSNVTYMDTMFSYSEATTGYARTQTDVDRFNASSGKPAALTFTVK